MGYAANTYCRTGAPYLPGGVSNIFQKWFEITDDNNSQSEK
jgi:hypothetical protein